ncbi:MAG TPA: response regulator transcription factor [Gaiellaceae bacterium]|nr:response regulator transcription factor [Gaiellaceae bacterium]
MSAVEPVQQLRVLIADDHAPTRDDIRRALTEGDLIVCAEAADAARAVQQALETRPDICLLDLRMPGGGVAAAWEIAARLPTTKVVMFTVSAEDADLFSALRAGAVGYLVKDIDLRLLPSALTDVVAGKAAIPPALVSRMVKQFHTNEPRFRTTTVETDTGPRLTSREWDVLAGLAEGLSTRDIGRRLQLKPSGVRAHISAIVQKLGVENRQGAIEFFRSATDR